MSKPLDVFIGFDERESIAYHVLADSIKRHATIDVNVRPLITENIPAFTRPRDPKQSTDFAFSRFMVPYLSDYRGTSIFMDCDMLMRADIAELLADVPERADVSVCQHDYTPKGFLESGAECGITHEYGKDGQPFLQHSECDECRRRARLGIWAKGPTKFLGQVQTAYPRKNWSSLMVFDNVACRKLTPYYVNRASAADLHRLAWAKDIGALPLTWNHLVGEYPDDPDAKCWHWTIGGPWFPDYANTAHADEWRAARDRMLACS